MEGVKVNEYKITENKHMEVLISSPLDARKQRKPTEGFCRCV